ncbi:MAG: carboxypeptidase regulatory-like domain-containing protein [Vicinamibacterales bacterium]
MHRSIRLCTLLLATALVSVGAAQQRQGGAGQPGQQPARDTPAQTQDTPPSPKGLVSGRVLASDNGRPVKRARVFVTAAELPGGRGVLTDDEGRFQLTELPAGRYTLTVQKSGFVSLAFGQRRPLQAGTPLQLADGQEIKGIEFRLPRGSVIAGHVFDEDGDPMPGVVVRVLRYQYQQGDRRLVSAGTSQTDDRGQFRVWGLMPGDYYVDAQTRINVAGLGPAGGPGGGGRGGRGGPPAGGGLAGQIAGAVGAIAGANIAALFGPVDESQKAYAPTYFPGVTAIDEARPITLGLSQESENVDFSLQLVHVARVSGRVSNADGTAATAGNVNLTSETNGGGRGNQLGVNYGSRIDWDGSFSMGNVPPGRYILRARSDDTGQPEFASQPLTVGGGGDDINNVSVILANGGSISGTISFPATQSQRPDLTQLRIAAPSLEPTVGNQSQARVDKDGNFTIDGIPAGPHLIRPNGPLRGWTLKAVLVNGRDVTDTPIDLRSGQRVADVSITFTDKVNEINGTITNEQGAPITEYTVLAFSTDPSYWQVQSRHIATARPDQTGKFRIRGLPTGTYYLATVDPAQQGEWFNPTYLEEHRIGASRVSLAEGDTKTQDFKLKSQN